MSVRRGFLSLLALVGALLGAQLFYPGPAVAQPEDEEITEKNSLIDCSTNKAYNNKYIASAFKAGGGHKGGSGRQCSACHKSDSPRVGRGDKPRARQGTALVHNRLDEAVTYSVKYGKKGEWKEIDLEPGAVYRHTWKYKKANQNRSPQVWVKYEGADGKERVRRIKLVATPNEKLGSVYYFNKTRKTRRTYLDAPDRQVSRR
jgi:hypothetical protein